MAKILVLEPDASLATTLADAIWSAGWSTVVIATGAEALARFSDEKPSLVILDLTLDGGKGLETCHGIRERAGGELVPILLLGTGEEGVKNFGDALVEGGDYYFGKPIDVGKVISKVRTYVGAEKEETTQSAPMPKGSKDVLQGVRPGASEGKHPPGSPPVHPPGQQAPQPSPPAKKASESGLAGRVEQMMGLGAAFKDGLLAPPSGAEGGRLEQLEKHLFGDAGDTAPLEDEPTIRHSIDPRLVGASRKAAAAQPKKAAPGPGFPAQLEKIDAKAKDHAELFDSTGEIDELAAEALAISELEKEISPKPKPRPVVKAEKPSVTAPEGAKKPAEPKEPPKKEDRKAEGVGKDFSEKVRAVSEQRARIEAIEKARKEAEEKARKEAEDALRVRKEAEEKARKEAEEKARKEAEEKARKEADAKAKARREAELKAQREAEERAQQEAAERARHEAEERAQQEAAERARREAEERAQQEAAERAQREAEEQALREVEEKARRTAAEQAQREAEEKALREAEARARQLAEERARREAEEKVRREAEETARALQAAEARTRAEQEDRGPKTDVIEKHPVLEAFDEDASLRDELPTEEVLHEQSAPPAPGDAEPAPEALGGDAEGGAGEEAGSVALEDLAQGASKWVEQQIEKDRIAPPPGASPGVLEPVEGEPEVRVPTLHGGEKLVELLQWEAKQARIKAGTEVKAPKAPTAVPGLPPLPAEEAPGKEPRPRPRVLPAAEPEEESEYTRAETADYTPPPQSPPIGADEGFLGEQTSRFAEGLEPEAPTERPASTAWAKRAADRRVPREVPERPRNVKLREEAERWRHPPEEEPAPREEIFVPPVMPDLKPPDPDHARLEQEMVPAVLWRLHRQAVTGAVVFQSGADKKEVFYEAGVPVAIRSSQTAERLEEMLYREGLIDRSAYAEARIKGIAQPRALAAHLVERGYLKAEELFPVVRRHFEECLLGLFEWPEGQVGFHGSFAPDAEKVKLARPMPAIILEGVRRKFLLDRMVKFLGSPASLLAPIPPEDRSSQVSDPQAVGFTREEREVLALVNGLRPIEEIVFLSGQDAVTVYRVLTAGVLMGLVAVAVRGVGAVAEDEQENIRRSLDINRKRVEAKFEQTNRASYFEILGVSESATPYEINNAHKRLSHEFHPMHFAHADLKDLEEKLAIIRRTLDEARDVLCDEMLRASYQRSVSPEKPLQA